MEKELKNEGVEALWDFRIQTDTHLPHNTREITDIDKEEKKVWRAEIAVPGGSRIQDKELERRT